MDIRGIKQVRRELIRRVAASSCLRVVLAACLCVAACAPGWRVSAREGSQETRGREARAIQAGEVLVVLNEQFFNAILEASLVLTDPPKFALARGQEGRKEAACASEVVLARESEGRRTAVRLEGGRINVVAAFRGSYEAALLGCLSFEGWADAALDLAFDREHQVLTGRVTVRDVRLKNFPALLTGNIKGLVQASVDRSLNPLEILRAEQLGGRLPLAQGNSLRLRAREVRHEIAQQELRLRISYDIVRGE